MNATEDWSALTDANGDLYDPRPALNAIESGRGASGYKELWERVHHQGDLGSAAYAVVPPLTGLIRQASVPDWRAYALIATIEERLPAKGNPPLPEWLSGSYHSALQGVVQPALAHLQAAVGDLEVRSILAVLALAKGQRTLAAIAMWTEDERQEVLGEL